MRLVHGEATACRPGGVVTRHGIGHMLSRARTVSPFWGPRWRSHRSARCTSVPIRGARPRGSVRTVLGLRGSGQRAHRRGQSPRMDVARGRRRLLPHIATTARSPHLAPDRRAYCFCYPGIQLVRSEGGRHLTSRDTSDEALVPRATTSRSRTRCLTRRGLRPTSSPTCEAADQAEYQLIVLDPPNSPRPKHVPTRLFYKTSTSGAHRSPRRPPAHVFCSAREMRTVQDRRGRGRCAVMPRSAAPGPRRHPYDSRPEVSTERALLQAA